MASRKRKPLMPRKPLLEQQIEWLAEEGQTHMEVALTYNVENGLWNSFLMSERALSVTLAVGEPSPTIAETLKELSAELARRDPDELVAVIRRGAQW